MKKTTLYLTILLLIAMLSSCSPMLNSIDNEQTESEAKERTTLRFAVQTDSTAATLEVITKFNSSQDVYEVEPVYLSNDSEYMKDLIITSLSGRSSKYDIISMDVVWVSDFVNKGFLYPIDEMIEESGLLKDQFNISSMQAGNYEGSQYTLPFFQDVGLLYFRRDIVDEVDAAKLISGQYTYEELGEMARKYTQQKGTKVGFVYQSKQYEGLTVNVNEFTDSFSDIEKGLQLMHDFTNAEWAAPDILSMTETETYLYFEKGYAVFARNWPNQFGRIKEQQAGVDIQLTDVGVAPLPNGGTIGGWLLGINEHSKHKEGAWEFLQFATSEEGQSIMSSFGGYISANKNVLLKQQASSDSISLYDYEGFQNALDRAINRPKNGNYLQFSNGIQESVYRYLKSEKELNGTVEAIESQLNNAR